jgi:DNA invertase Pin-like site-specific DNA recombinase
MRKAAIYLRVSTQDQTTANQERELRAVAERMGIETKNRLQEPLAAIWSRYGSLGRSGAYPARTQTRLALAQMQGHH